jgi:hypothetical protein
VLAMPTTIKWWHAAVGHQEIDRNTNFIHVTRFT